MKRLLIVICFMFTTIQGVNAESSAQDLSSECNITINDVEVNEDMLDKSIYTSTSFQQADILKVNCEQKIKYVYIKYVNAPHSFQMKVNNKTVDVATKGFLHELITLDKSSKNIQFLSNDNAIADISFYGEGTLPKDVQNFNEPYKKCDMLVFPTHSDDDTLYFGIPITTYADQGYRIQIAYLVNHNDTIDRPHELLDGLWEMGITAYPIISDFSDIRAMSLDSALDAYDEDAVLAYQVENIRRFKPSVVLDHDINGEYGHGVHMLNTYLMKQAITLSGDTNTYPDSASKYGVWTPLKTYFHMYIENTIYLDENYILSDGTTSIDKAKIAFSHHLSQQQWVLDVIPSGEGDCRMFGLYQTSVGLDTTNNMFEHIEKEEDRINSLIDLLMKPFKQIMESII